ncbi:MAG TPA: response regulator [Polyangiales bacterium]
MVAEATTTHDVLVVEDDDDTRALVRGWLRELGFQVRTEVEGQAGIEAACATPPAIALIDIGLPGVDGYEVVRAVRERLGRKVYLVAITGFTAPADCAKALESGYDAYVAKPLTKAALSRVIANR